MSKVKRLLPRPRPLTYETKVSLDGFNELMQPIIGQPISRIWQGGGSSIFFEIGALAEIQMTRRDGSSRVSLQGQYTIMVEWYWRIEKLRSIWFGVGSSDRVIDNRTKKMIGTTIEAISLVGRLPELNVAFSNNLWLQTFAPIESYPRWVVFLDRTAPIQQWVHFRGKGLTRENDLKPKRRGQDD